MKMIVLIEELLIIYLSCKIVGKVSLFCNVFKWFKVRIN